MQKLRPWELKVWIFGGIFCIFMPFQLVVSCYAYNYLFESFLLFLCSEMFEQLNNCQNPQWSPVKMGSVWSLNIYNFPSPCEERSASISMAWAAAIVPRDLSWRVEQGTLHPNPFQEIIQPGSLCWKRQAGGTWPNMAQNCPGASRWCQDSVNTSDGSVSVP